MRNSAGGVRCGVAQFYVGRNSMNRNRHAEQVAAVECIRKPNIEIL